MNIALLQQTDIGKLVTQLKKHLKDEANAISIANNLLVSWKELAIKEAASKKRSRDQSGVDELANPNPEKKLKTSDESQSSTSSSGTQSTGATSSASPASTTSATSTSNTITSNATTESKPLVHLVPKLTIPTQSLRKEFVTRIEESLKNIPSDVLQRVTVAPLDTAILIEKAVFASTKDTNDAYKTQLRLLNYHMKHNHSLRERTALAELEPEKLATMSADDLVSDEQKAEAARIEYEVTEARKPLKLEANCSTEPCPKCHSNQVHVTQAQTRSADEPMTQFFTCIVCTKKWKK